MRHRLHEKQTLGPVEKARRVLLNSDQVNQVPKMLPSAYILDKTRSLHEKLAHTAVQPHKIKITNLNNQTHSKLNIDRPIFTPYPANIVIQNFTPFKLYNIEIRFKNNDSVPRKLKIDRIDHPCLGITGASSDSLLAKCVAPGMDVVFILQFTPEDDSRDYNYNLVVNTEREQFLVPIKAIGKRAILDFPDELSFIDSPVRFSSTKTLLVRNIGTRAAKFTLDVEPPFYPSPPTGYLEIGGMMQVDLDFRPMVSLRLI